MKKIILLFSLLLSQFGFAMPQDLYHSLLSQTLKDPVKTLRTLESLKEKHGYDLTDPEYLVLRLQLAISTSRMDDADELIQKSNSESYPLTLRYQLYINKIYSFSYKADYKRALEYSKKLLAIANEMNSQEHVLLAYSFLVTNYSDNNRLNEAAEIAQACLQLIEEAGSDFVKYHIYSGLSDYYYVSENYPMSIEMLDNALTLTRKIGNNVVTNKLTFVKGEMQYSQSLFDEAYDSYLESFKLSTKLQDTVGIAYAAYGLSNIYNQRSEFQSAKNHIDLALKEFKLSQEDRLILAAEATLAEILISLGEYSQAESIINTLENYGDELIADSFRNFEEWTARRNKDIAIGRNDLESAIENYESIIQINQTRLEEARNKDFNQLKNEVNLGLEADGIHQNQKSKTYYELKISDLNDKLFSNWLAFAMLAMFVILLLSYEIYKRVQKARAEKIVGNLRLLNRKEILTELSQFFKRFKNSNHFFQVAMIQINDFQKLGHHKNQQFDSYKGVKGLLMELPDYWTFGELKSGVVVAIVPLQQQDSLMNSKQIIMDGLRPIEQIGHLDFKVGSSLPIDSDVDAHSVLSRAEQALFIAINQSHSNYEIRLAS